MTYALAPEAKRDLDAIKRYLLGKRASAAKLVLQDIRAACELLGAHPALGRSQQDLAPDVKSFPVRSYMVLYEVDQPAIRILRVIHGKRDLPTALLDP